MGSRDITTPLSGRVVRRLCDMNRAISLLCCLCFRFRQVIQVVLTASPVTPRMGLPSSTPPVLPLICQSPSGDTRETCVCRRRWTMTQRTCMSSMSRPLIKVTFTWLWWFKWYWY